jgi:LysM repeat protein
MAHQPTARPALIMQRGPQPGQVFGLHKGVLTIGRAADNDIVIDDPQVSRYHARLIRWGDGWVLEDLGSPNGILVNGQRISGRVMLNAGSQVAFGANVLFGMAEAYAPSAAFSRTLPGRKAGRKAWWLVPVALALIAVLVALPVGLLWLAGRAADVREQPPRVAVRMLQTGDQVAADRVVVLEAATMDDAGVTQVELWVDGELVDAEVPPDPASPEPALVPLAWQPDSPGTHTVMVRVTNSSGVVNQEAVVVEAVEDLVAVGDDGQQVTIADVSEVYYVAGQGDTLDAISRMYDVDAAQIVALNPGLDPVALAPGTVVAVPFDAAGFLDAREAGEDEEPANGKGGGPPGPPVFAPNPPDQPEPTGAPPDLMITNLTLSNYNPAPGEAVTVGVTIFNAGGTPAENFSWSWGPGTGEGRIEAEPPIDLLVPGDDVVREMTYIYQEAGTYTGRARVDPQDTVEEGDEGNNTALADIAVGTVPAGSVDLAITNFTLSNYAPAPGEDVTVGVTIANLGDATAEGFTWSWCSGTGEGCKHVAPPVDFLAPGDDVVREITYVYEEAGQYAARVRVDSHDVYDEGENEANNVARAEVNVGGVAAGGPVDLAITNLTLSAFNPRPGEEVIVGVTIANLGGMPAEDVRWTWHPGTGLPYVHVEEPIPLLAPGEDVVREITYVYEEEGTYYASAIVDIWGDYPQDDDNQVSVDVRVSQAGASVGTGVPASSGGLGDLGDWAQDLAGASPPAAPQIISAQFYEAGDYESACYTVLEWRDRSDNESGFKVYRWDMARDEFALVATLASNDEFDIVQYADTTTTPELGASAGPNWYYVVAYNGGGEAASNYVTVEVTPACVGGGWWGLSGAEIEFVGMIVDKQYEKFYCYVSLDDSPWFRVPDDQDEFMPVEYGPIEDDLFGMGGSGDSYYHVNLFDYLGGWNSLVIYPESHDPFSVGLECFGWRDGRLHNLGTYTKDHPYETWDDEVATGWLEEAHGPDGWFAFWYATRQALVYRNEETPTLFDDSLPAPTDLHIVPEDCTWWHDSCSVRWHWAGDGGNVDWFHVGDDRKALDLWLDPSLRHIDVDPFDIYPYPYCDDNRIEVAAYRDVHRGQPAYLDIRDDTCAGQAVVDVHFDEVQFWRAESPGVVNACMDSERKDIETIDGYIKISGLDKQVEFGPVGIGPAREGVFTILTVPPCDPVDLDDALSRWNPWIEGGRVYPRLGDDDYLTIEWRFYADIYDKQTGFTGTNALVCKGKQTYGPLRASEWSGLRLQTQVHTGEDDYGEYGCQISWSINW